MLLYYITDRTQFPGDEVTRRRLLLDKIAEAVACGIDFIQLREKDLPTRELEALACDVVRVARKNFPGHSEPVRSNRQPKTSLLVNSRTDVAVSSAADGVHLRSDDISPRDVRLVWPHGANARESAHTVPVIGVSCHTPAEVERAQAAGADFVVFGPVFEKKRREKSTQDSLPPNLDLLGKACRHKIPVLALGGITLGNARTCLDAGAAGIAAIRLFQENEIAEVVRRLRT